VAHEHNLFHVKFREGLEFATVRADLRNLRAVALAHHSVFTATKRNPNTGRALNSGAKLIE
jgi:nucleoid DNA-binding protein